MHYELVAKDILMDVGHVISVHGGVVGFLTGVEVLRFGLISEA
jgi:hypothetical protein